MGVMNSYRWLIVIAGLLLASCTKPEDKQTDNSIKVKLVTLNKSTLTLTEGDSFALSATILPEDADDQSVSWSSSDEAVASVSDEGLVLAKKEGKATVTVTTHDGGKTASCAVTVEAQLDPSVTIGATHISCISAVLSGKANLGKTSAADLKMGIMYSKSSGVLPSTSTMIEATDIEAEYYYSIQLTDLEPETTYYYRSYVYQGGENTYGDTKSFTTKKVEDMIKTNDVSELGPTSVVLNATLDTTDCRCSHLSYGFYYSEGETANPSTFIPSENLEGGNFSRALNNLLSGRQYSFAACVRFSSNGSIRYLGEVKSFCTERTAVDSVGLDMTEYTFNSIGSTLTLGATVFPTYATDKSVEWSSDNESVATVSSSGTVKAIGNGTANITVTTTDQKKTATCTITVAQWVTGITLDKTSLSIAIGNEAMLSVTILPDNANDKTYTWSSSDSSIASVDNSGKVTAKAKGNATIKVTANDGSGVFASCAVVVKNPCPAGAVDLGLSVYWATSNIVASKPEDHGDYYAWGEVETKENYTWSTYKFGTSSSGPFSKYNTKSSKGTVDNKTVLDPEDDVAHVKLGGKWRMPTDEEWTELRTKCTWTLTDNYNGTGVKGRIVTATNGNSIFLPAAGSRYGTSLYNAGSVGTYWSSSLLDGSSDAWYLSFNESSVNRRYFDRCDGRPVRPVSE